jgi:hypothetical protein
VHTLHHGTCIHLWFHCRLGRNLSLVDSFYPEDPALVLQLTNNDTTTMPSHGLYKPLLLTKIGAAAWILECSDKGVVH